MTDSVVIREFQPTDEQAVVEITQAAYGASVDPKEVYEYWARGIRADSTSYMVAEIGGRVVGTQPMEYFDYTFAKGNCKGGILTGVAVHPNFQGMGIFTKLVQACEEAAWLHGASFVTTMPNDKSKPGFIKMGYVDLGQRSLAVRVLNGGELVRKKIPWIGQLFGATGAFVQNSLFRISKGVPGKLCEVNEPSSDWESLFLSKCSQDRGLGITRNLEWLLWRYKKMPVRKYRYFELRSQSDECLAVCVTTQETRSSIAIAYLLEYCAANREAGCSLIGKLNQLLQQEAVHLVATVVSSPTSKRQLQSSGMIFVPHWAPIKRFYSVARFHPSLPIHESWRSIDGWNQWLGDWDSL